MPRGVLQSTRLCLSVVIQVELQNCSDGVVAFPGLLLRGFLPDKDNEIFYRKIRSRAFWHKLQILNSLDSSKDIGQSIKIPKTFEQF